MQTDNCCIQLKRAAITLYVVSRTNEILVFGVEKDVKTARFRRGDKYSIDKHDVV